MELENLFETIDEALIVDQVNDYELGRIVRKWYWAYKNEGNIEDLNWEDLTEEEEWSEFMVGGWDDE